MCYAKCDSALQQTERRWVKTYMALYETDEETANANLDDRIAGLNADRDVCCGDVLVILADEQEAWEEAMCSTRRK